MRTRFSNQNCSVAAALDVIGDGWSLMILREAFLGTRRFSDFQRATGAARNILSDRLTHLEDHGILQRIDVGVHGTRHEYALTPQGKDLSVVLTALRQWGDRWIHPDAEPLLVVDRRTGEPIAPLRMHDAEGTPISGRHLELRPGPGATAETLARFEASKSRTGSR
ncbi:MAG: helix-turn-helix transcriptional regulator [Proteobacteria bacterium]|nr:helix-turn-helix transcriptional regulator [Pseudomonadota bacterium]